MATYGALSLKWAFRYLSKKEKTRYLYEKLPPNAVLVMLPPTRTLKIKMNFLLQYNNTLCIYLQLH